MRVCVGVESWSTYNNTPQKHFAICGEASDQLIPITFPISCMQHADNDLQFILTQNAVQSENRIRHTYAVPV